MIEHRIGATNVKSLFILDDPANSGEAHSKFRGSWSACLPI